MRYTGFLIYLLIIQSCQNETDNIIIWEDDEYECKVEKDIFNNKLDNYALAITEEGELAKTLKKEIKETTKNVWELADDKEVRSLLENWRNRFYWDNNLTFIDKATDQVVTRVTEGKIHDLSGTLDVIIIGSDTLFKVRSIIF